MLSLHRLLDTANRYAPTAATTPIAATANIGNFNIADKMKPAITPNKARFGNVRISRQMPSAGKMPPASLMPLHNHWGA
ncbi:hypothetical protein MCC02031_21680 [Bifidobacteriaceae bacterium MCC02031]|nr:hypothetical protein MCC02031_21680 [Bifidobacteriaceae bacterium MCC02031]